MAQEAIDAAIEERKARGMAEQMVRQAVKAKMDAENRVQVAAAACSPPAPPPPPPPAVVPFPDC